MEGVIFFLYTGTNECIVKKLTEKDNEELFLFFSFLCSVSPHFYNRHLISK